MYEFYFFEFKKKNLLFLNIFIYVISFFIYKENIESYYLKNKIILFFYLFLIKNLINKINLSLYIQLILLINSINLT